MALLVTRGFGNGTFNGSIGEAALRGYSSGEAVAAAEEIYSGGYFFDFEALRPRATFRAKTREEKEAKPILEDIAKHIEPDYDSRDLEIILRLRLRQQHIIYKNLYLKWLEAQKKALKKKIKREIVKKRQDEEEILLLYLLTE